MCDESVNAILWCGHVVRKDCFVVFTASRSPFVILCPNLMLVQTSKGNVPHTYKELFGRIMAFEYEKLLLLKSSQNKVTSNIAMTGERVKQVRHISQGHFEILILK